MLLRRGGGRYSATTGLSYAIKSVMDEEGKVSRSVLTIESLEKVELSLNQTTVPK
jgi:hypothetical protein